MLFVLSALSCGIALVLAISQFTRARMTFAAVLRHVMMSDVAVIVSEGLVLAAFLVAALSVDPALLETNTGVAAVASVQDLMSGSWSVLFWGGFVGVGLVSPLVIELVLVQMERTGATVALATSVCVLVGGFVMRFCIVEAGMRPELVMTTLGLG